MKKHDFDRESRVVLRRKRSWLAALCRGYWKDSCDAVIESWPSSPMTQGELDRLLYEKGTERLHDKYGSVLATILIAILIEVIKLMIDRWWNNNAMTTVES